MANRLCKTCNIKASQYAMYLINVSPPAHAKKWDAYCPKCWSALSEAQRTPGGHVGEQIKEPIQPWSKLVLAKS